MWFFSIITFFLVAAAAYMLLRKSTRHATCVDERIASVRSTVVVQPNEEPGWRSIFDVRSILTPNSPEERKVLQDQFVQAGVYSDNALGAYYAIKTALMIAPPVVGFMLAMMGWINSTQAMLFGALAGGIGFALPIFWLQAKIRKRNATIRRSLPDFLDLMIVCMDSGLSLQGSLCRVSEELGVAHAELGAEMLLVQKDVELGASIDQALRRFADRSQCDAVRSLSMFLKEANRFGTEVSDALRMNSETLREQRENAAEAMAQKAAVKILMPTLLLIFPTVFVVIAGPAVIQILEAFAK